MRSFKYIVMILFVHHLYYVACDECILDVLKYRSYRTYVKHSNSIICYQYHVDDNDMLIKVVEGDVIIWERVNEDEKCTSVFSYLYYNKIKLLTLKLVKSGSNDFYKYYANFNYGWSEVANYIFDGKLNDLIKSCILDITKNDRNILLTYDYTIGGNIMNTFHSLKFEFIEVIEGDELIWSKDDSNFNCTHVVVYIRKNIRRLIYLVLFNGPEFNGLYYKKVDGQWKTIEKAEYISLVLRISNEVSLNINNTITANSLFNSVENNNINGIPSVLFIPKHNYLLTEVKDEDSIIWQSDLEEGISPYVILHHQGDVNIYLQIHFDNGDRHGDLYFENGNDGWKSIEEENFYIGLGEHDESMMMEDGTRA